MAHLLQSLEIQTKQSKKKLKLLALYQPPDVLLLPKKGFIHTRPESVCVYQESSNAPFFSQHYPF